MAETDKFAIIAVTAGGARLGSALAGQLERSDLYISSKVMKHANAAYARPFDGPLSSLLPRVFQDYSGLVIFLALGASVRLLAPLLKSKKTDPAVVVVDDAAKYAISTLSGHLGGANDLARRVASLLGAEPVISTGSDVLGTVAPDMIGRSLGWTVDNAENLTRAAMAIINGETVGLFQDAGERTWWDGPLPANIRPYDTLDSLKASSCSAALVITDRLLGRDYSGLLERSVVYRPKTLVVGLGCNRGAPLSEVQDAVLDLLAANSLSFRSVRNLATIDIKNSEEGITEFARLNSLPVTFFTSGELAAVKNAPNPSEAIRRIVGTPGVCEPAAMLSAAAECLLVPKTRTGNVTVAVARMEHEQAGGCQGERGRVFVVGLGPGACSQMTLRAKQTLDASDVIVGYKTYLDLIKGLVAGKQIVSSGMRQEVARARKAIEMAEAGHTVAVVCSGDAGVYGMAGLIYEVAAARRWDSVRRIEVVPGVSALNAASALLGAPLMHDFAVISLSDLLTPWETIIRRLRAAGEGDFVVALYNPKSGRRTRQIEDARGILREYRSGGTPVGVVTNAYRELQNIVVTDLDNLLEQQIGMLSTVIVGNSETTSFGGVMVTPRGYGNKYDLGECDRGE